MAKFNVGDRVLVKQAIGPHYTGTVERVRRSCVTFGLIKTYDVRLDGTALGHTHLAVVRMNLEHLKDDEQ
jgi:hypothetical protein